MTEIDMTHLFNSANPYPEISWNLSLPHLITPLSHYCAKSQKELLELRLRYSKLEAVARSMTKSRDEYKAIFDTAPEAIVILNRHGIMLDVNGRIYDWLGYKKSEIVGKHLLELPFIHEEGRKIITDKFFKRMSGETIPPYEIEFVAKTGERLIGRIIANPVIGRLHIDNHEETILDVVMISNITEISET